MSLAIDYDADIVTAMADLPQTVTIGGTDYTAAVSEVARGETLEMEGVIVDVDARVVMRTADLAAPAIGTKVTVNSRAYRIVRVVDSPCGAAFELTLSALTK